MKDLRSFLADWERQYPQDLCRIEKEVSVKYEPTALAAALEKRDLFPALIFQNPLTAQGNRSPFPLLTNLLASRRRCAAAIGVPLDQVAQGYFDRISQSRPPQVVSSKEAPVKEVIQKGAEVNLHEIPLVVHHEGTSGPRLTAAMATTFSASRLSIPSCSFMSYLPFQDVHRPDTQELRGVTMVGNLFPANEPIPCGRSTTIYHLLGALVNRARQGMPMRGLVLDDVLGAEGRGARHAPVRPYFRSL